MWSVQRIAYGTFVALGLAVFGAITIAAGLWSRPPKTAPELLGVPLPPSTREVQVTVDPDLVGGGYRAYVRLVLDPDELPTLLADPTFQSATVNTDPLVAFADSQVQNRPLAQLVMEQRPSWWQPSVGQPLTLVQRSRPFGQPSSTGPDVAWYIIEMTDAAHAVVYVYAREV